MKIKTTKLQEMAGKAVKGSGNNKLIPITSLIGIKLVDGDLTLITTDATNYLYIIEASVDGDDLSVTVEVDRFSQLISRMTSEFIEITQDDKYLLVKGNGEYKLELPVDENGEVIDYPDPLKEFDNEKVDATITKDTIQSILTTVKPSIATTMEIPCYTGYYVGDNVIGTDTSIVANMDVKLLDTPNLISPEMMNILDVMSAEKIDLSIKEDILVFKTDDCIVYGRSLEGIEDYQVGAINKLIDTPCESMCKVSKDHLLQTLDRISLFTTQYENNGVKLVFGTDNLEVSSLTASGVEVIKYTEAKNPKLYTVTIDVGIFMNQVKAQAGDLTEIWYGDDTFIKMKDGKITQILALLED